MKKGIHLHKGIIYREGSVLEDSRDLTKIFVNKFEKLDAEVPVTDIKTLDQIPVNINPNIPTAEIPQEPQEKEAPVQEVPTKASEQSAAAVIEKKAVVEEVPAMEGEDATARFAAARKKGMKVMKVKGEKYLVYKPDHSDAPLNPHPLKFKAVSEFIKSWEEN